jgi:hypothetical protein
LSCGSNSPRSTVCGRIFFVRSKTLVFSDLFSEDNIDTHGMERAIKDLEVVGPRQYPTDKLKCQRLNVDLNP